MVQQSTTLIDTFEIDNEAFIHFVQKQIDYDYSINYRMYYSMQI